ncbi:hypothetical protein BDN67DRAFT_973620 [Paxillus ammoniavirescens]|nr:hypothetical protein BDN67DRAFT_973620 [Paxillus ammoniavirescens]
MDTVREGGARELARERASEIQLRWLALRPAQMNTTRRQLLVPFRTTLRFQLNVDGIQVCKRGSAATGHRFPFNGMERVCKAPHTIVSLVSVKAPKLPNNPTQGVQSAQRGCTAMNSPEESRELHGHGGISRLVGAIGGCEASFVESLCPDIVQYKHVVSPSLSGEFIALVMTLAARRC